jgi:hypothetical protein
MKRWTLVFLAVGTLIAIAAYVLRKANEALDFISEAEAPDDLPDGVDGFRPTPQRDEGGL